MLLAAAGSDARRLLAMKDSLGKTAARWARFRGFAELAERLTAK